MSYHYSAAKGEHDTTLILAILIPAVSVFMNGFHNKNFLVLIFFSQCYKSKQKYTDYKTLNFNSVRWKN